MYLGQGVYIIYYISPIMISYIVLKDVLKWYHPLKPIKHSLHFVYTKTLIHNIC